MSILTTCLRWFGISGVLGSILFITGDLLYHHVPGSSKSPAEKMSGVSESRLLNAGILGLTGCWLYTLASVHLYIAFLPAGTAFAFAVSAFFAAIMIGYGMGHTAYFSIGSGAQVAVRLGATAESGAKLANTLFQRVVYIIYIPVVIASLMMVYGIVSGRSLYPRWMVVFLPVLIYLLKTPVVRILRGRLREILHDSYDNFTLFVFYVVSTIVLWNGGMA